MPTYSLINELMLQVKMSKEEVLAKKGAMVAYQGDVSFERSFLGAGGVQNVAMRSVTNEGLPLMVARGTGSVYYAHYGMHLTIVPLQGETLFVESDNVLAFDRHIRAGTQFLGSQGGAQGLIRGAAAGQGLFTTTLQGKGEVVIVSDGDAIGLDVTSERPVFVDPDAYIGHKGQLSSTIVTDVGWKTFLGQTSGESYQLKFTGNGTVYIQASER